MGDIRLWLKYHLLKTFPYSSAFCENPLHQWSEWFGGMLLERRDPVLEEYLKRELRIRDRILEKLQNAPDPGQRLEEVREEKRVILTALEKYESI